ncbi:hypothetical protein ABH935_006199 [Catenulispora sp. GAS73]
MFRDDMLRVRTVPAIDYYTPVDSDENDDDVPVIEFRASAGAVADRLDAMGVDADAVRAVLNEQFEEAGHDEEFLSALSDEYRAEVERSDTLLRTLDADTWIERFREAQADADADAAAADDRFRTGSRAWLLSQVDDWDERFLLRLYLLVMPDAQEVILDATALEQGGWVNDPAELASAALESMRDVAAAHSATVVLTEGRTDSEFLAVALGVLYPHLTDLIRFLDYEQKPEGGAGALVRLVKAFAAAGIANRVVALFDNDAAALDALRSLNTADLPPSIRVMRYPDTALAADYPTLGPPTVEAPQGSISRADVNGLAASVELYLGRDVLAGPTGELRPVH